MEFKCVKFEFEWKSNSNSISNHISNLLIYLANQPTRSGPISFLSVLQPAQPRAPFGPLTRAASLFLPFHCRVGPRRQPSLSFPFFPYPHDSCAGQPHQPGQRRRSSPTSSRGVARGRAARLARTPRTGARAGRETTGEKGMDAFALPNAHPRRAGASPGAPPAPGRRRAKGIGVLSP
jgi:hypothetical protein